MPLKKSKSNNAFEHNVKAEMHAGKPQNQALAIAYAVKRKAKKMAMGGMVNEEDTQEPVHADDGFLSAEDGWETPFHSDGSDEQELTESGFLPESHMDNEKGDAEEAESRADVVARIMRKMRRGA